MFFAPQIFKPGYGSSWASVTCMKVRKALTKGYRNRSVCFVLTLKNTWLVFSS